MLKSLTSIILISTLFISCSSLTNNPCPNEPFGQKYPDKSTDFESISNELVDELLYSVEFTNLKEYLLVTDFVDTQTLKGKNRLSFILSNSLKNALVNIDKFKVLEVETSKFFKIGDGGVKILSRELNSLLNRNIQTRFAVVGTYSITQKQLLIFLKLINLKSGLIEKSTLKSLSLTCEIKELAKR